MVWSELVAQLGKLVAGFLQKWGPVLIAFFKGRKDGEKAVQKKQNELSRNERNNQDEKDANVDRALRDPDVRERLRRIRDAGNSDPQ